MPRTYIIVCAGVLILQTTCIVAQGLPRKPTMQQVIGYRMQEQEQWANRQLPLNAVQFRMYSGIAERSRSPVMMQPRQQFVFSLQTFTGTSLNQSPAFSMYQPNPYPSIRVVQSRAGSSRNWWMDPGNAVGSTVLRDIITNNYR